MKNFNGKAIYQPAGKAAEYAKWACNLFLGCSNLCHYCYLRRGRFAKVLGGDKPQLKKCFKDENHALEIFEKELKQNLSELQKHGIFFSFTTDPMLRETFNLTMMAIKMCLAAKVPVKILTKVAVWVDFFIVNAKFSGNSSFFPEWKNYIAFGFTLTGHDELEPNASTNAERIEAIKKLHDAGFKTFASIEPIIDFYHSVLMIEATSLFCDLYKIGLQSGVKYDSIDCKLLIGYFEHDPIKIYFKDSFLKTAGINREDLPENCVNSDYNLFEKL